MWVQLGRATKKTNTLTFYGKTCVKFLELSSKYDDLAHFISIQNALQHSKAAKWRQIT